MIQLILVRLFWAAVMIFLTTVVIFAIQNVVPGDPVLARMGDLAASDPEFVARFREQWGLDKPALEQFGIFISHALQGDLGMSIRTSRPVLDDVLQYAPATVELATLAFIMALAIGIPLGILAAVFRDRWIDHLARAVSLFGVAAPAFWLAFIFLVIFYGMLQIAPGPGRLDIISMPPPTITGLLLIDSVIAGDYEVFSDALYHLMLPASVLAISVLGIITRSTRASMLDTLSQDYVQVARAKGLGEAGVVIRHALPNALIPIVTLGGITFAQLLTGAVMTETIFSWPGLGRYTFLSASSMDFPAIMGVTLIVAVTYVVINLLVDISYAYLNPRSVQ